MCVTALGAARSVLDALPTELLTASPGRVQEAKRKTQVEYPLSKMLAKGSLSDFGCFQTANCFELGILTRT